MGGRNNARSLVARRASANSTTAWCVYHCQVTSPLTSFQLANLRLARDCGIPSDGRMRLLTAVAQDTSVDMADTTCSAANGEYQGNSAVLTPKKAGTDEP